MRTVANTGRGRNTTPQQRRQILELVQQLEDGNPTPCVALCS